MIPYFFLYQDVGLFLLRLALGAAFIVHGRPKLFAGRAATAAWFDSLGIRPGSFWVIVVGLAEFVGGMLVAAGLFAQIAAALIAIDMLVAMAKVRWRSAKFVETERSGWELDAIYCAAAAALVALGPGRYSLDYLLGIRFAW